MNQEPRSGFVAGILIGAVVAGGIVWWMRGQAVETAEHRAKSVESRADDRLKEGSDERLELLETIPAGNGTAYLYDSSRGKVWIVTPDGVRPVAAPKP